MKNLHHILGVPRRLLIPKPVYKEADNKVLEEVLVITFYLMAGQTSVIKGDTIIHFGFGKNSYILGELLQFKQRISKKVTVMPLTDCLHLRLVCIFSVTIKQGLLILYKSI